MKIKFKQLLNFCNFSSTFDEVKIKILKIGHLQKNLIIFPKFKFSQDGNKATSNLTFEKKDFIERMKKKIRKLLNLENLHSIFDEVNMK